MNPGVYEDMSSEEYFTAKDWVSASKLKHHLPEFYKPHTPDGPRDALDFGTAFHTTVLGTGEPILPVAFSTWAGKGAKELRESAYASGAVPLLEKELPRIAAMEQALRNHSEAWGIFSDAGSAEVSIFAEVDGIPCKARFDWLTKQAVGVDLKTTSGRPGEHSMTRTVIDYGYDLQADHYLRVASAAGLVVDTFKFVFVSKEPPHHVTVVELDEEFYERAEALRDMALQRMSYPEMVDAYPGATGVMELTLPRWARL